MKWIQITGDAWRALFRHRLRSLLSTLGIVFAVVAVVTMLAIAEGAKKEILEQIEGLGTSNVIIRTLTLTEAQEIDALRHLSRGLNLEDVRALEQTAPFLTRLAPVRIVKAALSASITQDPLEILAVTESYRHVKDLMLREGRFICEADTLRRNLVCVLGGEVSKLLGEKGQLGGALRLEDRIYHIVGILHEREWVQRKTSVFSVHNYNRAVFIPMGTEVTQVQPPDGSGNVSEIWVQLNQNENVHSCAEAIDRMISVRHGGVKDFQIIVPQELLIQAQKTQRIFNFVLGCIAGISLLVGAIGIMNTMLANVAERTKEIGIRRAVGASRGHIVLHFLFESVILTIAGGCIGILLGVCGAFVISRVAGWTTVLTVWSLTSSILMAGCVGLISGLYPSMKAAGFDPALALRHE